jgi:hypothetical protein
MSFPFAQMPTVGRFITIALAHGCVRVQPPVEVSGPQGAVRTRCLQGKSKRILVITVDDDRERLRPLVLMNWCRALQLDEELFLQGDPLD